VKKAYRSLARRWHPDKNKNDDAAASRFRDINEAYRTLSDPEKRRRYDRLGPLYTEDGRPPKPEDVNEVVTGMFGSLFGRGRGERGEDLRYTITVTLEEVGRGVDKEIVVPRRVPCNTCGGDGADPQGGKTSCDVCKGSGKGSGRVFRTACYHCGGRGYVVTKPCGGCSGDGLRGIEDALRVRVPAGVATGLKLKLAGKGNAAKADGDAGDLLVIVNVAEHELFRRRGDDLLVDLPLTMAELVLGADVPIPTLDGATAIRVPPGSTPGRILRLGGRGLPKVGSSARGDLHVELSLDVPQGISEAQAQSLRAWANSLAPTSHPRRARFDRAVQERTG
jgi:molecular chaperone DnaJ